MGKRRQKMVVQPDCAGDFFPKAVTIESNECGEGEKEKEKDGPAPQESTTTLAKNNIALLALEKIINGMATTFLFIFSETFNAATYRNVTVTAFNCLCMGVLLVFTPYDIVLSIMKASSGPDCRGVTFGERRLFDKFEIVTWIFLAAISCFADWAAQLYFLSLNVEAFGEILRPLAVSILGGGVHPTHFRAVFPHLTFVEYFMYELFFPVLISVVGSYLFLTLFLFPYERGFDLRKKPLLARFLDVPFSILACIAWVIVLTKRMGAGFLLKDFWNGITRFLFIPCEFLCFPVAYAFITLELYLFGRLFYSRLIKADTSWRSLSQEGSQITLKDFGIMALHCLVSITLLLPSRFFFSEYASPFPGRVPSCQAE